MAATEKGLLRLQNGSDVRGVAVAGVADEPVNLTPEAVCRSAMGFIDFLEKKTGRPASDMKVTIGRDSRVSGPELKKAAIGGLTSRGARVIDCGLASTPAMFMTTVFDEIKADGAIMLTASHLPYNRNGMKFFTKDGGAEKSDVKRILEAAACHMADHGNTSDVEKYDLITRYSAFLREKVSEGLKKSPEEKPLSGMHVVVDAGNGNGGFFATKVLEPLGADISGSVYLEPDGMFPNHIPNPENKQAMASIKNAVLSSHADLGLIFDTDVDRMGAVLSSGEELSRNSLIAMIAAIIAPEYPGSTIVTDSVTSDELTVFLEHALGFKHLRYKRGYRNVIDKCIELNHKGETSPLAIETSGHGALKENFYLDDGAYLAVKILIAAAKARIAGVNIGALIGKLGHPAESREYRMTISGVDDVQAYGARVLDTYRSRAAKKGISAAEPSYEGVRLVFPNGWALLRMSLHDPVMPLNIESKEQGGCATIAKEIRGFLSGLDALDIGVLGK